MRLLPEQDLLLKLALACALVLSFAGGFGASSGSSRRAGVSVRPTGQSVAVPYDFSASPMELLLGVRAADTGDAPVADAEGYGAEGAIGNGSELP